MRLGEAAGGRAPGNQDPREADGPSPPSRRTPLQADHPHGRTGGGNRIAPAGGRAGAIRLVGGGRSRDGEVMGLHRPDGRPPGHAIWSDTGCITPCPRPA